MYKLFFLFFSVFMCSGTTIDAQDIYGYWVGVITEKGEQFKFEINIEKGERKDPVVLHCRSCRKLKGDIIDHRDVEKIIDVFGIINGDQSVNLIDSKLAFKEKYEGEIRTRYQVAIEIKGGVPWLVGYYQDYNAKGRKIRQGQIYLKRDSSKDSKA